MNQELLNYIAEQLKNGVGKEEISKSLMAGGGWTYTDINAAFTMLSSRPAAPVIPTIPAVPAPTNINVVGKTEEDTYKELLQKGYSIAQIQELIGESKKVGAKGEVQGKAVKTVLTIAGVLIGAGLFSFIAANWSGIPDLFKLLILAATIIVFNGAGFYAKVSYGSPELGESLFFVGSFAYGGSIFLIGQIFNLEIAWFDGFVLWMLGVSLMAYFSETKANYGLSVILAVISLGTGMGAIMQGPESFVLIESKNVYSMSLLFCFLAFLVTYSSGILAWRRINSQLK